MPRKYELTWNKTQKRWFKKYKGKQYCITVGGQSATKEDSYPIALAKWLERKAEIDRQADEPPDFAPQRLASDYATYLEQLDFQHGWAVKRGDNATQTAIELELAQRKKDLANHKPLPDHLRASVPKPPAIERFAEEAFYAKAEPVPTTSNLTYNVKAFLKLKKATVSAMRTEATRCALVDFQETLAGDDVAVINAISLENYHLTLLERIKKSEISRNTGRDRLTVAKSFIRYLWERNLIELPRNLEKLKITVGTKEIEILSNDVINTLIENSHEGMKLYILLMLNCGLTQVDIADLTHSEIDWKQGRLMRKRSKTEHHEGVPVVNYKLWEETFKLLKKLKSRHETLVFLTKNGTPLRRETIDDNGKYSKTCVITSTFNQMAKKLNLECSPKMLRKTASSKLAEHEKFGKFAQYFLGHAPSSIADRHYVKPNEQQFDEALTWLGQQFGY